MVFLFRLSYSLLTPLIGHVHPLDYHFRNLRELEQHKQGCGIRPDPYHMYESLSCHHRPLLIIIRDIRCLLLNQVRT